MPYKMNKRDSLNRPKRTIPAQVQPVVMPELNICLEDNNGGDVIELRSLGAGRYKFKIGYMCVWLIDVEGTPSEIAKEILNKLAYPYQIS